MPIFSFCVFVTDHIGYGPCSLRCNDRSIKPPPVSVSSVTFLWPGPLVLNELLPLSLHLVSGLEVDPSDVG